MTMTIARYTITVSNTRIIVITANHLDTLEKDGQLFKPDEESSVPNSTCIAFSMVDTTANKTMIVARNLPRYSFYWA